MFFQFLQITAGEQLPVRDPTISLHVGNGAHTRYDRGYRRVTQAELKRQSGQAGAILRKERF